MTAMSDTFILDPRIAETSLALGQTELCVVRLVNDSRYRWLVLVPARPSIVELFDLTPEDRRSLIDSASNIAACMAAAFSAEKMNVGNLGNRVRQFHLHIIARHSNDAAWPDAVWNGTPAVPYEAAEAENVVTRLRGCLSLHGTGSGQTDRSCLQAIQPPKLNLQQL